MEDLLEYELTVKSEFTIIRGASDYTKFKRDLILYHQFVDKNKTSIVCEVNPNAKYKSYELRNNILWGCLYNKRVCLNKCPTMF
jgi:hypothetical protein